MNSNPNMVFFNRSFDKKRLKALLLWFRLNLSEGAALKAVEILQGLGFRSATQGAISLGLDDLKTPASKGGRVFQAQLEVSLAHHEHHRGNRTPVELFQHLVDTWHRTSQDLTAEVIKLFHSTERVNPVYMMAFSGARGNISQVRQLVGMRGLMADPRGQIVGFPILSNFREGLTITEYFVSCYGARKGVVDTAIRTADAGYLTRRLADVSHHVVVRTTNCGTHRSIRLRDIKEGQKTVLSLASRLVGRVLSERISKPSGKFADPNEEITPDLAPKLASQHLEVSVRSPLSCSLRWGVCQLCYGWGLSEGRRVTLGEAVGIIAAQSIGEPGTQLTLRTFHTGGVFSGDLLNEIRAPYMGTILFSKPLQGVLVRTPHGQIAFLTKVSGKMVLSPTIFSGMWNLGDQTTGNSSNNSSNLKLKQVQVSSSYGNKVKFWSSTKLDSEGIYELLTLTPGREKKNSLANYEVDTMDLLTPYPPEGDKEGGSPLTPEGSGLKPSSYLNSLPLSGLKVNSHQRLLDIKGVYGADRKAVHQLISPKVDHRSLFLKESKPSFYPVGIRLDSKNIHQVNKKKKAYGALVSKHFIKVFNFYGKDDPELSNEVRFEKETTADRDEVDYKNSRQAFFTLLTEENVSKNKLNQEFVLQPSTVIFVRQKEQVYQNQLLAEFSSSNLQSTNDQIEVTQQVLSEVAGQIWFKEIYYGNRKGPGSGSLGTYFSSQKLGGIWVLSGRPPSQLVLTDRQSFPVGCTKLSKISNGTFKKRISKDSEAIFPEETQVFTPIDNQANHTNGHIYGVDAPILTPVDRSFSGLKTGHQLLTLSSNVGKYEVDTNVDTYFQRGITVGSEPSLGSNPRLVDKKARFEKEHVSSCDSKEFVVTRFLESLIPYKKKLIQRNISIPLPNGNFFGHQKLFTKNCLQRSFSQQNRLKIYKTSVTNPQHDSNFLKYHYSLGYSQFVRWIDTPVALFPRLIGQLCWNNFETNLSWRPSLTLWKQKLGIYYCFPVNNGITKNNRFSSSNRTFNPEESISTNLNTAVLSFTPRQNRKITNFVSLPFENTLKKVLKCHQKTSKLNRPVFTAGQYKIDREANHEVDLLLGTQIVKKTAPVWWLPKNWKTNPGILVENPLFSNRKERQGQLFWLLTSSLVDKGFSFRYKTETFTRLNICWNKISESFDIRTEEKIQKAKKNSNKLDTKGIYGMLTLTPRGKKKVSAANYEVKTIDLLTPCPPALDGLEPSSYLNSLPLSLTPCLPPSSPLWRLEVKSQSKVSSNQRLLKNFALTYNKNTGTGLMFHQPLTSYASLFANYKSQNFSSVAKLMHAFNLKWRKCSSVNKGIYSPSQQSYTFENFVILMCEKLFASHSLKNSFDTAVFTSVDREANQDLINPEVSATNYQVNTMDLLNPYPPKRGKEGGRLLDTKGIFEKNTPVFADPHKGLTVDCYKFSNNYQNWPITFGNKVINFVGRQMNEGKCLSDTVSIYDQDKNSKKSTDISTQKEICLQKISKLLTINSFWQALSITNYPQQTRESKSKSKVVFNKKTTRGMNQKLTRSKIHNTVPITPFGLESNNNLLTPKVDRESLQLRVSEQISSSNEKLPDFVFKFPNYEEKKGQNKPISLKKSTWLCVNVSTTKLFPSSSKIFSTNKFWQMRSLFKTREKKRLIERNDGSFDQHNVHTVHLPIVPFPYIIESCCEFFQHTKLISRNKKANTPSSKGPNGVRVVTAGSSYQRRNLTKEPAIEFFKAQERLPISKVFYSSLNRTCNDISIDSEANYEVDINTGLFFSKTTPLSSGEKTKVSFSKIPSLSTDINTDVSSSKRTSLSKVKTCYHSNCGTPVQGNLLPLIRQNFWEESCSKINDDCVAEHYKDTEGFYGVKKRSPAHIKLGTSNQVQSKNFYRGNRSLVAPVTRKNRAISSDLVEKKGSTLTWECVYQTKLDLRLSNMHFETSLPIKTTINLESRYTAANLKMPSTNTLAFVSTSVSKVKKCHYVYKKTRLNKIYPTFWTEIKKAFRYILFRILLNCKNFCVVDKFFSESIDTSTRLFSSKQLLLPTGVSTHVSSSKVATLPITDNQAQLVTFIGNGADIKTIKQICIPLKRATLLSKNNLLLGLWNKKQNLTLTPEGGKEGLEPSSGSAQRLLKNTNFWYENLANVLSVLENYNRNVGDKTYLFKLFKNCIFTSSVVKLNVPNNLRLQPYSYDVAICNQPSKSFVLSDGARISLHTCVSSEFVTNTLHPLYKSRESFYQVDVFSRTTIQSNFGSLYSVNTCGIKGQAPWYSLVKSSNNKVSKKTCGSLQEIPHTNCLCLIEQIIEYPQKSSTLNEWVTNKRKKLKYSPFSFDLFKKLVGKKLFTFTLKKLNNVLNPQVKEHVLPVTNTILSGNKQFTLINCPIYLRWYTCYAHSEAIYGVQFDGEAKDELPELRSYLNSLPLSLTLYGSQSKVSSNQRLLYNKNIFTREPTDVNTGVLLDEMKKIGANPFINFSSGTFSNFQEPVVRFFKLLQNSLNCIYSVETKVFTPPQTKGNYSIDRKCFVNFKTEQPLPIFLAGVNISNFLRVKVLEQKKKFHVLENPFPYAKSCTSLPKPLLCESDQITFVADDFEDDKVLSSKSSPGGFTRKTRWQCVGVNTDVFSFNTVNTANYGVDKEANHDSQNVYGVDSLILTSGGAKKVSAANYEVDRIDLLTPYPPYPPEGSKEGDLQHRFEFSSSSNPRLLGSTNASTGIAIWNLHEDFSPHSVSSDSTFMGENRSIRDTFNLFPGQLVAYGESIAQNTATTESGQILYIDSHKTILRKAQTVLIYSQALIAVSSGEWIRKGAPLMALSYQKLVTGDIVQGLPKIEQFFEAPVLKDGTFWSDSLQAKLNQFFQEYREQLPLAEAVRKGFSEIQRVLVEGVQRVYISQGVLIADKHLEVIVRQMTCKGRILYSGDTGFLRNELVSLDKIESVNQVTYGQKALYHPQVRGITDASLESESFLSAASFQETTRVLSRDAIIGKTDLMRGLKERVIVGELVQAGTGLTNNNVYHLL